MRDRPGTGQSATSRGRLFSVAIALLALWPVRFHIPVWTVGALPGIFVARSVWASLTHGAKSLVLLGAVFCPLGAASVAVFRYSFVWTQESQRYLFLGPWLSCVGISLYWSSQRLGLRATVIIASIGGAAAGVANPEGAGNLWKYELSTWVLIAALAWAADRVRPIIIVSVPIVVLSAAAQSRSTIAYLGIGVAVAIFFSSGGAASSPRIRRVAMVAVTSFGTLVLLAELALQGYLGEKVQSVMAAQSSGGGLVDILSRARVEAWGNIHNFLAAPLAGGIGQQVTPEMIGRLQEGFGYAGANPYSNYLWGYILGASQVEMHSIAADLWWHLGVFGIVLIVVLLCWYLKALLGLDTVEVGKSCLIVVVARCLSDLAFGPVSDIRYAPIAVLLAMSTRSLRDATVRTREVTVNKIEAGSNSHA